MRQQGKWTRTSMAFLQSMFGLYCAVTNTTIIYLHYAQTTMTPRQKKPDHKHLKNCVYLLKRHLYLKYVSLVSNLNPIIYYKLKYWIETLKRLYHVVLDGIIKYELLLDMFGDSTFQNLVVIYNEKYFI